MLSRSFFSFVFGAVLMATSIQAQVGPQIINPANNATVYPGSKETIAFAYQNLGTGPVTVNISLWQDARATEKIQDVVTDYTLAPGNSSGVKLDFTKNGTYDWYVPHGMNFSFYLTVTETTHAQIGNFSLRSFPIMLHPSAATALFAPTFILLLPLLVLLFNI
ncbi:hypothetical protein [Absidia glauca]|uniref:Translocon-associated protein subunit beta n=1 Tax=Absidia glauca TaxID=4829 RepID=A0A168TCD7_ABSGL|nr:hypothetical protein [Absidia glauca]